MKCMSRNFIGMAATGMMLCTSTLYAQVVINELVKDERSAGSGQIPDTREFIELYNAGSSAVDISDWTLENYELVGGANLFFTMIPAQTMLAAGDYYVIGSSSVPNLDFDLGPGELWSDLNSLFELRDSSANLIDALAVDVFYDPQLANATTEQLSQVAGGVWGQIISCNTSFPQSLGRYLDGRDSNNNGYDFGMLPLTPGTSNNLPQLGAHVVPDVDGMATGTHVTGYGGSFVLPKVINPTVVSSDNPNAIPASPQGGNAIVAWDNTGGGNMVASNSLVTSFDLYAYLETGPLNVSVGDWEGETSIYGIGTTDPFFGFPDPTGMIYSDPHIEQNSSTGVGWLYQREELNGLEVLMLVDFNNGGNSRPSAEDWTIIQTIDLSAAPSDWHRLAINYNPATGEVTARYDDQVFNFTTVTDLLGTFYVGYREALSGGVPSVVRPPTYDLFVPVVDSADFDNDGDVDGNDFLVWQRGESPDPLSSEDLNLWKNQFGTTSAFSSSIIVPEPSSIVLLLSVCMCFLSKRWLT
ncbi:MAG: lamin tail domain-containing protein [Pirellulales bacterium]|nr:lamin tail domain-containing protein [Pirellulales bacterium]